jgi:hypothetical protein
LVTSSFYRLKKKLVLSFFHRSMRFVTKLRRQNSSFCSILDMSALVSSDIGGFSKPNTPRATEASAVLRKRFLDTKASTVFPYLVQNLS